MYSGRTSGLRLAQVSIGFLKSDLSSSIEITYQMAKNIRKAELIRPMM